MQIPVTKKLERQLLAMGVDPTLLADTAVLIHHAYHGISTRSYLRSLKKRTASVDGHNLTGMDIADQLDCLATRYVSSYPDEAKEIAAVVDPIHGYLEEVLHFEDYLSSKALLCSARVAGYLLATTLDETRLIYPRRFAWNVAKKENPTLNDWEWAYVQTVVEQYMDEYSHNLLEIAEYYRLTTNVRILHNTI